jgi:deoxyhypusine synthase
MFAQIDISRVITQSITGRASKVETENFALPFDPHSQSFAEFIDSLPGILKAPDLKAVAEEIARARSVGLPVILMMGAHVIKTGLAPIIIDLMERGLLSAVAMNSAGSIHDTESALFGVTSEDVGVNIRDGSFGMWRETGEFINGALSRMYESQEGAGFGETIGGAILEAKAPNSNVSILASGVRLSIPVTVHAAIGTDIIHQQPSMNAAATGELSFRDFKVLANVIKDLQGGGVVLNVGSAVILPEVFLKALTVARNLGNPCHGFTTANFDMIQHYRPGLNVVARPTQDGGRGYTFTGHHEIMLPLLAAMIKLHVKQ